MNNNESLLRGEQLAHEIIQSAKNKQKEMTKTALVEAQNELGQIK